MAYTSSQFKLVKGGVINEWVYDTADSLATVLGSGYVTDAVTISNSTPGKGLLEGDNVLLRRYGTVGTTSTFAGSYDLVVKSINTSTGVATLIAKGDQFEPFNIAVVWTAGGSVNEATITATVQDADGNTLANVYAFELYFSDAATGAGLTASTYSGTLVADTGAILTTLTAKKHFSVQTDATGVFVGTLTDTNEPATSYAVAVLPSGNVSVSNISSTLWG